MKLSGVVITRNDNYGGNLKFRSAFCINSMINTFDEVWLIDWNTPKEQSPLLYDIQEDIEFKGNLNHIVIPPDAVRILTRYDKNAQAVCEVLARNIGIRRATGDWIVSTNIDVIAPAKEELIDAIESRLDSNTFYTLSRRGTDPKLLEGFTPKDWEAARAHLTELLPERHFPEKTVEGDNYSIINCCGDFQIAHRDLWHEIRGMEESLVYCLYTDTNVQKKAVMHGYGLKAIYNPPIFHIDHGKGGGGFLDGINLVCNNMQEAIVDANKTTNEETWGFSNVEMEWEVV